MNHAFSTGAHGQYDSQYKRGECPSIRPYATGYDSGYGGGGGGVGVGGYGEDGYRAHLYRGGMIDNTPSKSKSRITVRD